jgi:aminomethyltransferase
MNNPLVLHHEKEGATLNRERVTLRYTSIDEEYWSVRKSVGIADLSHMGRLSIEGKDRVAFLNGLLSNDLSKAKENTGIHSVLLNSKGRVLADLYLHHETDRIVMDTGEEPSSQVKQILDQFIITEDVKIEDLNEKTVLLSVQGPESKQILKEMFKMNIEDLGPLQNRILGPSLIIARDRTGQGGYDILVPSDEAESVWQSFLLNGKHNLLPVGTEALEILRLEAGLPKYGVDVDENTIVLEAGYQDAISFTKGCYMGQEVVARATHIGRVNRRLAQFYVEGKEHLPSGAKILANEGPVGLITSAAFSPGLGKTVALGYVGRDYASIGKELMVEDAGKELSAVVSKIV